jgi:hypothetical protein
VSPQNLVRRQAEVAERLAEWLAIVNRLEELLPYVVRQPLVRSRPFPGSLPVTVGPAAFGAMTAAMPSLQMCRGLPWSSLGNASGPLPPFVA